MDSKEQSADKTTELFYAEDTYAYIEAMYKDIWSAQKDADGWQSSTKWEQFDGKFQTKYETIQADYQLMLGKETPDFSEGTWQQIRNDAAFYAYEEMSVLEHMDRAEFVSVGTEALKASERSDHRDEMSEFMAALEEKAENGGGLEYLVRGAALQCLCGSHMRHLNMIETHGVYLDDKPLIHKMDAEPEENIPFFGICKNINGTLTEVDSIMRGAGTDIKGNYLSKPDNQILTGFVCKPEFLNHEWKNTKEETQIADDAAEGNLAAATFYDAVTTASYLYCRHGGVVVPLTSGQFELSAYQAEYAAYPGDKFGSPDFYKWCYENGVCPYLPGTNTYDRWFQNKIDQAGSDKDKKKLYQRYLDGYYEKGLDRMSAAEQEHVQEILDGYLNSELLSGRAQAQVQDRYSGLRINYGANEQKQAIDAIPKQPEFYEYYQDKFEQYETEWKEADRQMYEASKTVHMNAGESYTEKMRAIDRKKDELYQEFSQEMKRFTGHLSEDNMTAANEVHERYYKNYSAAEVRTLEEELGID